MQKSLKKDSRGSSPLMIIIVIVIVIILALIGWYVYKNKNNNSSGSNAATTAVDSATEDACKKLYNDKDLCKFASHYNPNASYKATFTNTDKDGKATGMTVEADTKGNTSSTITDGGKESGAFVMLDGDSYIKDETDGSWTKYPKSPDAPATTNPTSDLKIDFKDESAKAQDQRIVYKNLGKEACGSATCFKYQVIDPSQAGTTSYIWFGTKDYQLHQWAFTDKDGNKNVGTFTYASVTIKAPTPIKAAPAATATPSAADIQKAIEQAQQQAQ